MPAQTKIKRPTMKQRLAVKFMVEGGLRTSPAMRAAGYSRKTAVVPSKLTDSVGYKVILREMGVGSEQLAVIHKKHLKSKTERISLDALDMAYKIHGFYSPDRHIHGKVNIDRILDNLDEQAKASTQPKAEG